MGTGWCQTGARWCKCEQDTSASMSASRIISGCCWIMLGARRCWVVLGAGWCRTTIRKRRSRDFKQKKVYQNRTLMKEVISKNVHPAPIRIQHRCRTIQHRCLIWHPSGTCPTPVPDRPAPVRHPVRHHRSPSWNLHELLFFITATCNVHVASWVQFLVTIPFLDLLMTHRIL